jgi:hypothetical protein
MNSQTWLKNKEFYSILYYFESRVVWLDLTVENILYYFFIKIVW